MSIFHTVKIKTYWRKNIYWSCLQNSQFYTLKSYFKMFSTTVQQISFNKQTIFEDQGQILLHCYPFRVSQCQIWHLHRRECNGTRVAAKMCTFTLESTYFTVSSTSVPFTLTTVQVPNLALTHTKWFTVYFSATSIDL